MGNGIGSGNRKEKESGKRKEKEKGHAAHTNR